MAFPHGDFTFLLQADEFGLFSCWRLEPCLETGHIWAIDLRLELWQQVIVDDGSNFCRTSHLDVSIRGRQCR